MSQNRRGIPKTALNEDFAKKVRHSMRELQNDARKIPSFLQCPPSITPREYEPTYGRINIAGTGHS